MYSLAHLSLDANSCAMLQSLRGELACEISEHDAGSSVMVFSSTTDCADRFTILTAALTLCAVENVLASRNKVEVRTPFAERPTAGQSMKVDEDLGAGNGEEFFFARIADIAVGPAGRIYVIESAQNKVLVFEKNGPFLDSFGQQGEGPADSASLPLFCSCIYEHM